MNESERINELADALVILAGAVESVASRQCNVDASNDAQGARETVRRGRDVVILLPTDPASRRPLSDVEGLLTYRPERRDRWPARSDAPTDAEAGASRDRREASPATDWRTPAAPPCTSYRSKRKAAK